MPDWSYHPLFKPILSHLPSRLARACTLGAMGAISRLPGGTLLIKTLGHMELNPHLKSEIAGIEVSTPIGLSGMVDPHAQAQHALAQFGLGYCEIGPVTMEPIHTDLPIILNQDQVSIQYPNANENDGVDAVLERFNIGKYADLPAFIRLRHQNGSSAEAASLEYIQLIDQLNSKAAGFFIDCFDAEWNIDELIICLQTIRDDVRQKHMVASKLLLYIPMDVPDSWLEQLYRLNLLLMWDGLVISDERTLTPNDATEKLMISSSGKTCIKQVLSNIQDYLDRKGTNLPIIVSGGVYEPEDAGAWICQGADSVMLHSGMIFSGPGFPKRVNEAILYERLKDEAPPIYPSFWKNWGWMCFLGIGMAIGGFLAWYIAATSVLLPYDEGFLGLTYQELSTLHPDLIHFMSHDRITLAGTMISIGILYFSFAYFGLRQGSHWARTSLITSNIVGFSSFFLFVGYGYFDPLHALVAVILLPLFILSLKGHRDLPDRNKPNMKNHAAWKKAQWGQLCFVILGVSLAVGGITIAVVGISFVFVKTDLQFIGLTTEQIDRIHHRLIPLIAHDRAGFGGALFSNAVALTGAALWGIQEGRRWLWWTLLIGGLPAFIAVLGVHAHIGYSDFLHLSPVYFAVLLFVIGLILLYPYMIKNQKVNVKKGES